MPAQAGSTGRLGKILAAACAIFVAIATDLHAAGCIPLAPMTPKKSSASPAKAQSSGRVATYSISDLAQEFALTTRAIRFYEGEGLLAPERKGHARIYGERERVRIKLILRGKRLGLSLAEIRELFDIYALARNEHAQLSKFLSMLADRRAMLKQQREDIDAVLVEIGGLERDCRRRLKQEEAARHSGHPSPGPAAVD